jgi:predicted flap endonuclease-1-like 5' DNA nuclease
MVNYKIEELEQIDSITAEKLRSVGINTVLKLLENTKTTKQREEISNKTGIDVSQILRYTNMADLFRVHGIGREYSDLLEHSGVDTIIELSKRDAINLTEKIEEVNNEYKFVKKLPSLNEVQDWINQSKELERFLEY